MRPGKHELDLDLKVLANVYDPFPLYRWLRDHEPVHWSSSLNAWAVTRYADVLEIFEQPIRFSSDRFRKIDEKYASRRPAVRAVGAILDDWLVFRDPPDHTRLRSLLQKSFTPTQLAKSRERIQATVDCLLDLVAERGEMDFIKEVAFPLPATVIAVLLGAPTVDIELIKQWSDRLAAYLGGSVDGRDNFSEARDGVKQLVDYFQALLGERQRSSRDDLMSLMLRAEHDQLTRERSLPSSPSSRADAALEAEPGVDGECGRGVSPLRRTGAGDDQGGNRRHRMARMQNPPRRYGAAVHVVGQSRSPAIPAARCARCSA